MFQCIAFNEKYQGDCIENIVANFKNRLERRKKSWKAPSPWQKDTFTQVALAQDSADAAPRSSSSKADAISALTGAVSQVISTGQEVFGEIFDQKEEDIPPLNHHTKLGSPAGEIAQFGADKFEDAKRAYDDYLQQVLT